MKTYYFYNKDSNDETFTSMMSFLDSLTLEDEAQIYINSGGGSCWMFIAFITRLNHMHEQGYKIALRAMFVGSMAFDMFYKYKGPRIVEYSADGIVHTVATEIDVNKNTIRSNDPTERGRKEWTDNNQDEPYPFLTEDEKKKFIDGYDIYLSYDRMVEIFGQCV